MNTTNVKNKSTSVTKWFQTQGNTESSKSQWIRNSLIAIYVLFVLGLSATARANPSLMPIFVDQPPVETNFYQGQVAVTLDGQSYLVVSDNEFYSLTANFDISEFNGMEVIIEAHEILYRVGPVIEVQSLDPLQDAISRRQPAPVLVVLGITEAQLH